MPIIPTVGRNVHYFPQGDDLKGQRFGSEPLVALVCGVTDYARRVNLAVFGADGSGPYARTGVPLQQDGEPMQAGVSYAAWMDYQKGQAAKTEQLEQKLGDSDKGATAGGQPGPNPLDRDGDGKAGGSLPASERIDPAVYEKAKAHNIDLRQSTDDIVAQVAAAEAKKPAEG